VQVQVQVSIPRESHWEKKKEKKKGKNVLNNFAVHYLSDADNDTLLYSTVQ